MERLMHTIALTSAEWYVSNHGGRLDRKAREKLFRQTYDVVMGALFVLAERVERKVEFSDN